MAVERRSATVQIAIVVARLDAEARLLPAVVVEAVAEAVVELVVVVLVLVVVAVRARRVVDGVGREALYTTSTGEGKTNSEESQESFENILPQEKLGTCVTYKRKPRCRLANPHNCKYELLSWNEVTRR